MQQIEKGQHNKVVKHQSLLMRYIWQNLLPQDTSRTNYSDTNAFA